MNSPQHEFDAYALDAMILARCRHALGHEMKNAVQGLSSGIEVLARIIEPSSKAKVSAAECVALLKRQVEGLQQKLAQILDNVAPEYSEATTFDVAAVLKDIARFLMSDAAVANVRLQLELPEQLPVKARPATIRRVLLGFVLDGIDAVRGGGTLNVSALGEQGSVRITFRDSRYRTTATPQRAGGESTPIDGERLRQLAQVLIAQDGGNCSFDERGAEGWLTHITLPEGARGEEAASD